MRQETDAAPLDVDPRGNHLLAALPDGEFSRLAPFLEPVRLPRPTELEAGNERIEFVYFPISGVVSAMTLMEDGRAIEVATIGNEGMTGQTAFNGG